MREKDLKEGLGDLAAKAEQDHEVQMARADLYKLAKYAIKLHDMLKQVPEEAGLEGWVQSKITKAADYIGSVYHHLDYEEATGELGESKDTHCSDKCCGSDVKAEDCTCAPSCEHCNCNAVNEDATPKLRKHANNLNKHIPDNKRSEEFVKIMATKYAVKYSIDADDLFDTYVAMFNVHQPQSPFLKNTNEGKFKSAAHRKAVHAGKSSGKKKMKKLRDNSDLQARLAAKLESKKKIEATKITPKNISASNIKSKKISPKTE